jgi:hypothetical protein
MTRKEFIADIKKSQNERANEIRELKSKAAEESRENTLFAAGLQSELVGKKYQFRHFHIARCEMRGRTRDQIESPATRTKPDEKFIAKIKKDWTNTLETLCPDPPRSLEEPADGSSRTCDSSIPA